MSQAGDVHSTSKLTSLYQDEMLSAVQQLNGRMARVQEDLRHLLNAPDGEPFTLAARRLIESLLDVVDTADGDPDLEEDDPTEDGGDAEPSLGSFDRLLNQELAWKSRGWGDIDAELDNADREPSLGSPDPYMPERFSQVHWAKGESHDREWDIGDSPQEDPAE